VNSTFYGVRSYKKHWDLNLSLCTGRHHVKLKEVLHGLEEWLAQYSSETLYISFRYRCFNSTDKTGELSAMQLLFQLLANKREIWLQNPTPVSYQVHLPTC
jgi:hypothetical protein